MAKKSDQKAVPCREAWQAVCDDERLPPGVRAQIKFIIPELAPMGSWADPRQRPRYMIFVTKPTEVPGFKRVFSATKDAPYWYSFYEALPPAE